MDDVFAMVNLEFFRASWRIWPGIEKAAVLEPFMQYLPDVRRWAADPDALGAQIDPARQPSRIWGIKRLCSAACSP